MRRRTTRLEAAAGVATFLVGLVACTGGGQPDGTTQVGSVSAAFLQHWATGDYGAAGALTTAPVVAAAALRSAAAELDATGVRFDRGPHPAHGSVGTAAFTAHWSITGVPAPWTYPGSLPLEKAGNRWLVVWSAGVIHPGLSAGEQLRATRSLPARAALRDDTGRPLFNPAAVVDVGIEPSRVTDLGSLTRTLARVLSVDAADLSTAVSAAKPNAFVPVITLRREAYQAVRAQIHDLPGTVFRTGTRLLAPTASFARLLLGTVGTPTAQVLASLGAGYLATDQLGRSGLQEALNSTLAGRAGAVITAGRRQIGRVPAAAGTPVRTTLDVNVQQAGDAALSTVDQPAAIVAVKPSTGAIVAVSSSPSTTFDIGLAGEYPAGSTFKMVTATSLLEHGVTTADAQVPCPGSITVDGKVLHNEGSFDLGTVSVQSAFAHSCNTSFAALAGHLAAGDLPATARKLGLGAGWSLPVTSFSGSVPAPNGPAEQAADAIGQGRVLVSPLAMALVAATISRGSAVIPQLIAGKTAAPAHPFVAPPASILAAVRPLMRAVVTEGTATGLDGVTGGPVYGKTGTAEYGTATPPKAHAWFAGYQGDLAFAVLVQGGESSSRTAVPIAAAFLARVHG